MYSGYNQCKAQFVPFISPFNQIATFDNTDPGTMFMDNGSFSLMADLIDPDVNDTTIQYDYHDITYHTNFHKQSAANIPQNVSPSNLRVNFTNVNLQLVKCPIPAHRKMAWNTSTGEKVSTKLTDGDFLSSLQVLLCIRASGISTSELEHPALDVAAGRIRIISSSFASQPNQLLIRQTEPINFYLDHGETVFLYLCYTSNRTEFNSINGEFQYQSGNAFTDCLFTFNAKVYLTEHKYGQ